MLAVRHLHKSIDRQPVLRDVSFELRRGMVAGLIGRNGAGKTTLLKTMSGVFDPDTGDVLLDGESVYRKPEIKREIVLLPDNPEALYGYTAEECARLYALVYPRFDRAAFDEMTRRFGLPANRKIRQLSRGMKMLASITLGIATRASYVLLDEPTNGIDPIAKQQVLSLLVEAVSEGMTLLIASHAMGDLERLSDMILLIRQGEVETHEIEDPSRGEAVKLQVVFDGEPPAAWLASPQVMVLEHVGRVYTLLVNREDGGAKLEELKRMKPLVLEELPLGLEDLFVWKLGGRSDEDR